MGGTLTILGCGGSAGVPAIGNWWGDCDPAEPKNLRTRPSVALQTQSTLVIVDTGPDFREQMNRAQLGCPDAVIITHEHSDHINGIDELRILQRLHRRERFPLYGFSNTLEKLNARLDYMFRETEGGFYPGVCTAMEVRAGAEIRVGDIAVTAFEQDHGTIKSMGLKIGNIGYSTDLKSLDDTAFETLKGIDIWIVDGGGYNSRTNPVHASITDVIDMNKKIGAARVILTHLPATMDYQTLLRELPKGFEPACDGMTLEWR